MLYDPLYMIIIIVSLALSGFASIMVKIQFSRGEKVRLSRDLSGAEVAKQVMESAGIRDVEIVRAGGILSDHYNPSNKTLALSQAVYNGRNASAAGVAAHEAGHAIQHASNYSPLWFRNAVVPMASIGSRLGPWIIIIGIVLGSAQGTALGYNVAIVGVLLFGVSTLFTLVTLPVEFNASARAKDKLLEMGIVTQGPESRAVSGVLSAAAMTYVAAAINSILLLLYWAGRAGLFGRRRD